MCLPLLGVALLIEGLEAGMSSCLQMTQQPQGSLHPALLLVLVKPNFQSWPSWLSVQGRAPGRSKKVQPHPQPLFFFSFWFFSRVTNLKQREESCSCKWSCQQNSASACCSEGLGSGWKTGAMFILEEISFKLNIYIFFWLIVIGDFFPLK